MEYSWTINGLLMEYQRNISVIIESDSQTLLAGKSPSNMGIYIVSHRTKCVVFQCHVWLPECVRILSTV